MRITIQYTKSQEELKWLSKHMNKSLTQTIKILIEDKFKELTTCPTAAEGTKNASIRDYK